MESRREQARVSWGKDGRWQSIIPESDFNEANKYNIGTDDPCEDWLGHPVWPY